MGRLGHLVGIAVLVIASLTGCVSPSGNRPVPTFVPPPTVTSGPTTKTYIVRRGSLFETLQVRGRVIAVRETLLFFKVSGWLKAFNVLPGEKVAEGEVIAELDAPSLEIELITAQHEAKIASLSTEQARKQASYQELTLARGELAQKRRVQEAEQAVKDGELRLSSAQERGASFDVQIRSANFAFTQTRITRDRAYLSYQAIAWRSGPEAEDALTRLEKAEPAFRAAEAEIDRLKIEKDINGLEVARLGKALEDARARLEAERQTATILAQENIQQKANYQMNTRLAEERETQRKALLERAQERFSGTQLKAAFAGTIVSVDAKPGAYLEPFASIGALADPSQLEVEVGVPEEKFDSVSVGQKATVVLDAYPGKRYQGTVRQLATKSTTWQGKTVYNVRITFDQSTGVPAVVRMGAEVEIMTRSKENVLLVPVGAIYTEGKDSFVEVLSEGGRKRVKVEKGISDGRQVEIIGGVREGDELVVS